MGYIAVIAASYILRFFPEFFSRPLLVLPALALAAAVMLCRGECALSLILAALMFHSVLQSVPYVSLDAAVPAEEISSLYGRVIQDSTMRRNGTGYRIAVSMAADGEGNLFSASGCIFVTAPQSDLCCGDRVRSDGRVSGEIFISYSAELLERSRLTEIRRVVLEWTRGRLRPYGDAGELALRLLSGTGERGEFSLTDDALASGLSHILALSGMHLSIIAMLISPPLVIILGRRWGRAAVTVFLFIFSFLTGWRPSLARAFIFRLLSGICGELEISFVLSFVILLALFPESAADLGAAYSFISLGGIFLVSERIGRALRRIFPIPPSLSSSLAASAGALLFTIPLTESISGSYQTGAVITSFPVSALITLFMALSIAVLIFPPLGIMLEYLYKAAESMFSIAALFPVSTGPMPYAVLIAVSAFLIIAGGERRGSRQL